MASHTASVQSDQQRIADLESSLSVALARLEVAEKREQRWRRENQELRASMREAGQNWVEGQRDAEGEPLPSMSPRRSASVRGSISVKDIGELDQVGPDAMVDSIPVDITTHEGKVPALLLFSGDCLEFVELRARVTPEEYVGIKTCTANPKSKREMHRTYSYGGNKGWLWRMMAPTGSSKPASLSSSPTSSTTNFEVIHGAEEEAGKPPRPPRGSEPIAVPPAPGGVVAKLGALARLSWNGVVSSATEWQHPPSPMKEAPASASRAESMSGGIRLRPPSEQLFYPVDDIPGNSGKTEASIASSEQESDDNLGSWEIFWKTGGGNGPLKSMTFTTTNEARAYIHNQLESWADRHMCSGSIKQLEEIIALEPTHPTIESRPTLIQAHEVPVGFVPPERPAAPEPQPTPEAEPGSSGDTVPPLHLVEGKWVPKLNSTSDILSEHHVRCLCHQLPKRMHQAPWELVYSTERHGISLHTLFRSAARWAYTILVVKDGAGYVFGSFCTEAWKMNPRYFGTGECFVFQLQPHMIAYPWKRKSKERNDFYQFATPDSIAVGGGGHFALWLDQDLAFGNSGISDTFGNISLASSKEFRIKGLELWGVRA
mmetsp:Transcript_7726/g.21997  ORF Transcript_7726/g.21997 Transcript_7726/m.21997 type:complete len:601 (+) Transcript_7726:324-2126(+)